MIAGTWIVATNFGCHPRCLHSMLQNNGVFVCYLRCVMEEKEKATKRLHVLEQDIRKLLQARGSVEQLQSLLKEKGVFLEEKALQSITTSRKIMLKAKKTVSPQVWFNLLSTATKWCDSELVLNCDLFNHQRGNICCKEWSWEEII